MQHADLSLWSVVVGAALRKRFVRRNRRSAKQPGVFRFVLVPNALATV
jgi:hypothetical protein